MSQLQVDRQMALTSTKPYMIYIFCYLYLPKQYGTKSMLNIYKFCIDFNKFFLPLKETTYLVFVLII